MSALSGGPLQRVSASSSAPAHSSPAPPAPRLPSVCVEDPLVRGETFQGHWEQLRDIATTQAVPSGDDMVAVLNLLDQMTSLLQLELEAEEALFAACCEAGDPDSPSGLDLDRDPLDSLREPVLPCLDLLLSDNILSHLLATSRMPVEDSHADQLRLQQLLLYETLLGSRQAKTLLSHQPFLRPMLELLNHFSAGCGDNNNRLAGEGGGGGGGSVKRLQNGASSSSEETELHLMLLLNQLCKQLAESLDLLDLFFQASQDRFKQVFSLLVRHLHREGHVGQTARDALLHCMALSRKNKEVGAYIASNSDFCPVRSLA